ncbi:uncharacterized protein LOC141606149 [Silene latifolia]|uniref:uncharacterized protein LOC141606149 n=1 Tax=Silene latifolia TaxID=37657 RepID=UPI003D771B44
MSSQNPEKIDSDVLASARQACYKARDAFYTCIETHSCDKSSESGCVGLLYPCQCKNSRVEYEKNCRPSWVKHFDRQYCAKKRGQRLLDDNEMRRGPLTLPQPYTFKEASSSS